MISRLTYFLISIFFYSIGISQGDKNFAIAEMQDGSVFLGEKIFQDENFVTFRLNQGDTILLNNLLIKNLLDNSNALIFPYRRYHKTTGRFFTFTFGFNMLNVTSEEPIISSHLQLAYLWRLTPSLSFGPALGFEFNEARVAGFTFNTSMSSINILSRYYLNKNKRRLYAVGRLGYGFPSEEDEVGPGEHSGGVSTMIGAGIQFPVKRKSSFHLTVLQYFQKTAGTEFFFDNLGNELKTDFDILIKRLIIRFGWDF